MLMRRTPYGTSHSALRTPDCALHSGLRTALRTPDSALRTLRLPEQDLFEKSQRPRVFRLAEPEHGLFADDGIRIGARELNQQRHAIVFRQLTQGEHRAALDLGLGIVRDGLRDRADGLLTRALREP